MLLSESVERRAAAALPPLAQVAGDVAREAAVYLQLVALLRKEG